MIALPIGLAVYLTTRWRLGWRPWLIGAATFVLSQVGHVPFNLGMSLALNRTPLVDLPQSGQRVLNAVLLGLSAGLFEELFRYGMFRWWLKDARSWRKAVLAGAGHGGAEAMILGGFALYGFLQAVALRGADLAQLLPADQVARALQQVDAYWSMAWYDSLLGAVERLFALPIQVALAVLVLQAFTRKQWAWVGLAVAYHALVDAAAVLALPYGGVYGTEAVVGGLAVVSLVIILVLRRPEPAPVPESVRTGTRVVFTPRPIEETPEKLDDTRYV
jgi:uncharacterized membrane protein YhfC